MTKRSMIRIVTFSIILAVAAGGAALAGWRSANGYKRSLENNYQRAFSELVSSVSGINYALQKSSISNSPSMMVALGSQVFRESAQATSALSQLPLEKLHLEKISKFISQVGDWSFSLAKSAANGVELNNTEEEALVRLAQAANSISVDLNDLCVEINENGFHFGEIAKISSDEKYSRDMSAVQSVAQNIAYLEQEFPEYPTLIYDGPFSEHIDQSEPAYLKGMEEIPQQRALQIAAEFLNVEKENIEFLGKNGGDIPVYTFSAVRDGGEISIDITCVGGVVIEMTDSRTPENKKLSLAQATEKAKEFLKEQGFGQMQESYWTVYSDAVMINFAPLEKNTILYPDLVKVSIALDDGRVCNFESYGYIMNHKPRQIPEAEISLNQAKDRISRSLKIKGYNLAIVPTTGNSEKFVYEIQCERSDGSHCLVYLDAKTGEEVQIFILIEDENGVLAM